MFGLLLALLSLISVAALVYAARPSSARHGKGSVQVVVLGDIGHSPRMQYHAASIVSHGGHVDIVGYLESELIPGLQHRRSIHVSALSKFPRAFQTQSKLLFLVTAPLKVLHQVWSLWKAMAQDIPASEWMLVQNPPSIPTLIIAILVCRLRRSKLVIDWHNTGCSILALKLGGDHPLVRLAILYEQFFANFADYHFTVAKAMHDMLLSNFGITRPILTLYDRPAPIFQPVAEDKRVAFLTNCDLTVKESQDILHGRTRLVVSSTSWTPDEDFSVLLEALCSYSASAISDSPHLPELLVVITGKGPQQQRYLKRIEKLKREVELEMVTIKSAWLPFEDYATLLGCADLGVSLHTSSSGVDLPMKVVDMFGTGLPVLGYSNFKAWSELVTEGVNGQGFSNAAQMSALLKTLFDPTNNGLKTLREGAMKESKRRWSSQWDPVAGKLFGLVT